MKYKIDEGNEQFPQMQRMNANMVRVYFDHSQEQHEDPQTGEMVTVYTAKYVDLICTEDPESPLVAAKEAVVIEITEYDCSPDVNEFTIGGDTMWLPDAKRTQLSKRFNTDEGEGLTETKIINEGKVYELPIATARQMMLQLEIYAKHCYDKTEEHKAAVNALTTVAGVCNYDYTVGYPPKLSF